ncbi:GDP-L-fucose synthase [Azoarcus sp. L1K30]|uniref:GDP-L-fucose synthase family protein n=1 Tax=Azoarcus sp. L1K30 TaxID=2820277 RepID=UPI001B82ED28|nr:GDP-L-fucose synthase [Azoarcus sp. L1K30]MBR0568976.1 GDP-L-fucose synthase [Azoarcus sp. L1K30]
MVAIAEGSVVSRDAKIFVAGHRGMVGSAIVRKLQALGYDNIVTRNRVQLDLLDQRSVLEFMAAQAPDYVFVAAAKVGGILANNIYRGQFLYENLTIQNNLIHGAHLAGVQRLMFLGSSCIYPKMAPQPITEDSLLTGLLEPTNEPYAIAKIAGIKLCDAYNAQYGHQYVSVMPTNLYGPNDSYDLTNSHVLPALIRKFHLAKLALAGDVAGIAADETRYGRIPDDIVSSLGLGRGGDGGLVAVGAPTGVLLWGTGTPMREFLYVDDLAAACVHLMQTGYDGPLVNIGTGEDITIRELAQVASEVVGYHGMVSFDATKPDGTPRKLLDVSRLKSLGYVAQTSLVEGVKLAYADYLSR